MNRTLKVLQFVVIVILIVIAAFFMSKMKDITADELAELMPDSVVLAAASLFVLFCLKAIVIVIPMVVLYVCAGIILPPATAIVFTLFCVAAELTIGFFAGRKLGYYRVKNLADSSKYTGKLFEKINDNVFISSFLLRLVPVFSADILSMIFGAADAKYLEFIAGSILGIIPSMVPVVLAGNSITKPMSEEFLIPFSICVVLSVSCTIAYRIISKKKEKKGKKKRV